jgi:hypothetical protein
MVRDELLIESYEIVEVLCETLLTRYNLLGFNFHPTKENPYPYVERLVVCIYVELKFD